MSNLIAFELYLGREMKPDEVAKERDYYVTLCLSKETQQRRQRMIKQEPKPKQLKLWT